MYSTLRNSNLHRCDDDDHHDDDDRAPDSPREGLAVSTRLPRGARSRHADATLEANARSLVDVMAGDWREEDLWRAFRKPE